MKKAILVLMLLFSTSIFAEWEKVETTDDFGEATGKFFIMNTFDVADDIFGAYFIEKLFVVKCTDDQFDWNFNDDIKISIKRKSGKIEAFYSDYISDGIVTFMPTKAVAIAKIFAEEKDVTIAIVTKDDKFISPLQLSGFSKIYDDFKKQK